MNAETDASAPQPETVVLQFKDPHLAAFLAWLVPGAGHLYQGRTSKGVLFMVCILGTFFYGMYLGGCRVVYASSRAEDRRLPYLCQLGVGLPALPAVVQMLRVHDRDAPKAPLWNGFMAPPVLPGDVVPAGRLDDKDIEPIPHTRQYVRASDDYDELAQWHATLHGYFELGTVYTMIAGLLNILAIYDAFAGPLLIMPNPKRKRRSAESDELQPSEPVLESSGHPRPGTAPS